MYADYFGLKEPGFSITPDPHYLYLSERHREALAHLLYGSGEGGGFVLLTGEVGTGKTTVCRAFLEQLPGQVDVALILNPAVTASELLQAICREFHLLLPPGETSIQALVAHLNEYLLATHAQGRRSLLLIDEAQNLQPAVLEQVRLLTNLETPKHKLLQVFLVGQPELRRLLDQDRLRQVAQRITARFHLTPLSSTETGSYIRHRLAVAGVTRQLFTPAAVRSIHRASGGIPRLINILCDRALLGAYASHSREVNRTIVRRAARELRDGPHRYFEWRLLPVSFLALTLVTLGWLLRLAGIPSASIPGGASDHPMVRAQEPATSHGEQRPSSVPRTLEALNASASPPTPATLPATFLLSRQAAMALLLQYWGVDLPSSQLEDPCAQAKKVGLRCRNGSGAWEGLTRYDRPAVIKVHDPQGELAYALVNGLDHDQVLLDSGNRQAWLPLTVLEPLWSGSFVILWRPPPGGYHLIGSGSPPRMIRWLRETLSRAGSSEVGHGQSDRFDASLRTALRAFQARNDLQPDGIAGPETLLRLNSVVGSPDIPHLQRAAL